MPTKYTCSELQYQIDEIDRELTEIRLHRRQLMYQKRCFKMEIARILRANKSDI